MINKGFQINSRKQNHWLRINLHPAASGISMGFSADLALKELTHISDLLRFSRWILKAFVSLLLFYSVLPISHINLDLPGTDVHSKRAWITKYTDVYKVLCVEALLYIDISRERSGREELHFVIAISFPPFSCNLCSGSTSTSGCLEERWRAELILVIVGWGHLYDFFRSVV